MNYLIAALLLTLTGCVSLRGPVFTPPTLATEEPRDLSIDFEQVHFTQPLILTNPLSADAYLQESRYTLRIGGQEITSGELSAPDRIAAKTSAEVLLPINLQFHDLMQRFGGFSDRESLPYTIQVDLAATAVEGSNEALVRASYTAEGTFPVLLAPRVVVDTLLLKSFSLAVAELELRIRVVNPNAVPLTFSATSLALMVDDQAWHRQELTQAFTVPGRSDVVFDTPFRMRPRDYGTDVYRKLNMEQPFDFTLNGQSRVQVDMQGFGSAVTWSFSPRGNQQFDRLSN